MPDLDLSPLPSLLAKFAPQGRTALLPALHAVQALYRHIPEAAAVEVGRALGVPLADIYGVIDFYTLFYKEPPVGTVIHICNDPACAMAGSEALMKNLAQTVEYTASGSQPRKVIIEKPPAWDYANTPRRCHFRQVRCLPPNLKRMRSRSAAINCTHAAWCTGICTS